METLGQKLRTAREKKRVTLSKAAAATRIKIQNLEMMEGDDFSKMPAPAYAKGFIRIYANFLGLDPSPLVQEYVDLHLNGPVEKPSRGPAPAMPVDGNNPVAEGTSLSGPRAAIITALKQAASKSADALKPHTQKIGIALGIVIVVLLVSRCVSGLGGTGDDLTGQQMRPEAIAREPAEQYLEIPAAGANP